MAEKALPFLTSTVPTQAHVTAPSPFVLHDNCALQSRSRSQSRNQTLEREFGTRNRQERERERESQGSRCPPALSYLNRVNAPREESGGSTYFCKPRDFLVLPHPFCLSLYKEREGRSGEVGMMAVAIRMAIVAVVAEAEEGGEKGAGMRGLRRRLMSRIYWKLRAEIRRRSDKRKRFSSRYDPFSYALNFDDGDSCF